MLYMVVTAPTFHELIFWLKANCVKNINDILVTKAVFQEPTG
jgi:hypothetical protein